LGYCGDKRKSLTRILDHPEDLDRRKFVVGTLRG
jgi:hypothetical protein